MDEKAVDVIFSLGINQVTDDAVKEAVDMICQGDGGDGFLRPQPHIGDSAALQPFGEVLIKSDFLSPPVCSNTEVVSR